MTPRPAARIFDLPTLEAAGLITDTGLIDWDAIDGAEDWSDEETGCECELDWNCGRHGYTETPEDRIATAWRREVEGPEMPF